MVRCLSSIALLLLVLRVQSQTPEDIRLQIDEFVAAILSCNQIPGVSLAVVRDAEVFYTRGYGVSELVTQDPMTDTHLVNIASVTKHFLSTTMAKVFELYPSYDWSSTVREILGDDFYLSDGYMSSKASVRDLLAHRVGLARHDAVRAAGWTLDDMVSRLRHLESSVDFRDGYQYNNLMYNLADRVVREITGRDNWEDVLQEWFLDPLEMNATTFVPRRETWDRYATSYDLDGGELREMSLEINSNDYELSTAAGGIGTDAVDMAKWMVFQLSGGQTPAGQQLVDAGLLRDTHDRTAVRGSSATFQFPEDPVTYETNAASLGWREGAYREHHISSHSGSKGGFNSLVTLFPDSELGIFSSLTGPDGLNSDYIHLFIADLLLNETAWLDPATICDQKRSPQTSKTSRSADIKHTPTTSRNSRSAHQKRTSKTTGPTARAPSLRPYEGAYGHFGYGNVTIFPNVTGSGDLDLEYGANLRLYLTQTSETEFTATGYGIYWATSYDVVFADADSGSYDRVTIDFDSRAPPTFVRGLDSGDAPPPPEPCG